MQIFPHFLLGEELLAITFLNNVRWTKKGLDPYFLWSLDLKNFINYTPIKKKYIYTIYIYNNFIFIF